LKAIQVERFGGPEVLQLAELAVPQPGEGEALIRVHRAGVNFADLSRREGVYGSRHLPQIMGVEVAGVRQDTGERVVALLLQGGGYAEYAAAPEHLVFGIPDRVSDEAAVALFEQGLTAYDVLFTMGHLKAGETVVVHAAAGGVGSLAVQLAKLHGARVIAVASSESKRALALGLGADAAIDAGSSGLTERILEANQNCKVNLVLEMVGGEVFDQSLAAVAPFGRLVVYGQASDIPNQVSTDDLMGGSKAVIGYWLWHTLEQRDQTERTLERLFSLNQQGKLQPVMGAVLPLHQAAEAHRQLGTRQPPESFF